MDLETTQLEGWLELLINFGIPAIVPWVSSKVVHGCIHWLQVPGLGSTLPFLSRPRGWCGDGPGPGERGRSGPWDYGPLA